MTMTMQMLERMVISEVENLHFRVDQLATTIQRIDDRLDRLERRVDLLTLAVEELRTEMRGYVADGALVRIVLERLEGLECEVACGLDGVLLEAGAADGVGDGREGGHEAVAGEDEAEAEVVGGGVAGGGRVEHVGLWSGAADRNHVVFYPVTVFLTRMMRRASASRFQRPAQATMTAWRIRFPAP